MSRSPPSHDALAARLEEAAATRRSRLDSLAFTASEHVSRAKDVAQHVRETQRRLADEGRTVYEGKLAAARARRHHYLLAVESAHASRRPDTFLRANATALERVRLGVAAVRLQARWRKHAPGTVRNLARAFVATGIPGTHEPTVKAAVPALPEHTPEDSASATPIDTPAVGTPVATSMEGSPAEASPAAAAATPSTPDDGSMQMLTGISGPSGNLPWQREFDRLSTAIQDKENIAGARALLRRLERMRVVLFGGRNATTVQLGKRLYPKTARKGVRIDSYPSRVFLCAYMLQCHPDALLNGGAWDAQLLQTCDAMLAAFERLMAAYLSDVDTGGESKRELLRQFDEAWTDYLELFLTWKGADAESIEEDLIRIAVTMQSSYLAAANRDPAGAAAGNPQLAEIAAQVERDHVLLRARLARLRGPDALARFDAAVAAAGPVAARRSSSAGSGRQRSPSVPGSPRELAGEGGDRGGPSRAGPSGGASGGPAAPSPLGGAASPVPPPQANEIMLHQLLVNPRWQLPLEIIEQRWEALMDSAGERRPMPPLDTATATPTAMQQHVTLVAQDALADAALAQLTELPQDVTETGLAGAVLGAFSQVLSIVTSLADEVFDSIPENHPSRAMQQEFQSNVLLARLSDAVQGEQGLAGGVAVVAGLLDRSVQLLLQVGAPGRDERARTAVERITVLLREALPAGPPSPNSRATSSRAVATVISRALRLLLCQLQMLKADAANGRLTVLAASLTPESAVSYAFSKLLERARLTEGGTRADVQAKLPISRDFCQAAGVLPVVPELFMQLESLENGNVSPPMPGSLQTGRVALSGAAPPPPGSLLARPLMLQRDVVSGWRGRFRCGMAALMLQPADLANNPTAPELLLPYGTTLDTAKGLFQKAIVEATCMAAAAEVARRAGTPLTPAQLSTLERHLSVIEAPGPAGLMQAAEEVIAAQVAGADAEAVGAELSRVLTPGGPVLQEAAGELLGMVQALLVFGRVEGLEGQPGKFTPLENPPRWAGALLRQPHRLAMHNRIAEVVHMLGRVAAVAEETYGKLLPHLLAE